jgi:outer membrane protein assembly factor BamB
VVKLTGTGFVAADTVRFNGTTAVVSKVNATGTTLTTSVPSFAASGIITLTDPTTGQTVGLPNQPFSVTSGIFPSPRHVWAGGQLVVSGSELSPNQIEPIYIGKVQLGEAQTDSSGNFQTSLSVPWSQRSGRTTISVRDVQYGTILSVFFIIGDWPALRHDSSRTGDDTYETALSISTVSKLSQKWGDPRYQASSTGVEPAVANGVVYWGDGHTGLTAHNASTGTVLWNEGSPYSSPAVADGKVYAGEVFCAQFCAGFVLAVYASTGAQVWGYPTTGVPSSPAVAGGTGYVGTDEGYVYAFNASTGATVWTGRVSEAGLSGPAVGNGTVFFTSTDGRVYALNALTGAAVWSYLTNNSIDSPPAVANGTVYIGSRDGNVYALNATTGTPIWTFSNGQTSAHAPVVANGVVYDTNGGGHIFALNASTDVPLWQVVTTQCCVGDLAVANGVVYGAYSNGGNVIIALNASTGSSIWSLTTSSFVGDPVVSNGMLYVPGSSANGSTGLVALGL